MINRVLAIVLGTILILGGALAGLVGAVLVWVGGTDGTLHTGKDHISTPTTAIVTAIGDINGTTGIPAAVDEPQLRVSLTSHGQPVFVGIARTADVNAYLAGAAIDKVTDFDVNPFTLKTERHDGSAHPANPAAQTFWVASAVGPSATVDWKVSDGSYRLVVMNADASTGFDVDGRFAITVPHLFWIGIGFISAATVTLAGGVLLVVFAARAPQRRADEGQLAAV